MLHQVLADAAAVGHHVDAVRAQLVRRADAASHQQHRRMDRAGRHDHLSRFDLALAIRSAHADAGAAGAVEHELLGARSAHHRQVGAPPHLRGQIAPGRAHPHRVGVAVGDRKEAVVETAVLVGDVGPALLFDRLHHAAREARPALARVALQADRSVLAVQRPVEIAVGFELSEERQHALPVPAGGARRGPAVVVGRQAAIGRHAVDRGAAADHPAGHIAHAPPPVRRVAGLRSVGGLEPAPDEALVRVGGGREDIENFRRLLPRRIVGAGFDQQHAGGRALGQPRRQRTARGAAADHHVVVFPDSSGRHVMPSCSLRGHAAAAGATAEGEKPVSATCWLHFDRAYFPFYRNYNPAHTRASTGDVDWRSGVRRPCASGLVSRAPGGPRTPPYGH